MLEPSGLSATANALFKPLSVELKAKHYSVPFRSILSGKEAGRVTSAENTDPHAKLARCAAAGDTLAFAEIVKQFQGRVRSVAIRMLGDAFEADDLAQEVFVSVYGALANFRSEAKLSTWIMRITRNHCLNRLKTRRRHSLGKERMARDASHLNTLPFVHGDPQRGPEAQMLSDETKLFVENAIAELPPKQRLLVVLRDIEGMSYEEIAEVTELRVGTVKSRLHRARERLVNMLAPLMSDIDAQRQP